MGIVQEMIVVLAITSSKIVYFVWSWSSQPYPSKEEYKKHHYTHVPIFFGGNRAFITYSWNSMGGLSRNRL
jgi:hypothetical protein